MHLKGEGLGNQFLANIREVDAIVHVVRCFEDSNVVHVDGSIDPVRDIETINLELIFSDIEIFERRIAKVTKTAMDKKLAKELDFLQKIKKWLEDGKMAITMELENEDEEAWMGTYNLLTQKPGDLCSQTLQRMTLANDGAYNAHVQAVRKVCSRAEQRGICDLRTDRGRDFRAGRG